MSVSSSVTNLLLIVGSDPLYVHTIATEFPPQHHLVRFLFALLLLICSIVYTVNVSLKEFVALWIILLLNYILAYRSQRNLVRGNVAIDHLRNRTGEFFHFFKKFFFR